jgi:hypothetical protein
MSDPKMCYFREIQNIASGCIKELDKKAGYVIGIALIVLPLMLLWIIKLMSFLSKFWLFSLSLSSLFVLGSLIFAFLVYWPRKGKYQVKRFEKKYEKSVFDKIIPVWALDVAKLKYTDFCEMDIDEDKLTESMCYDSFKLSQICRVKFSLVQLSYLFFALGFIVFLIVSLFNIDSIVILINQP